MGCRIISGFRDGTHECACFFDSVTEWAFGPMMGSTEEAEAFMTWLEADETRATPIFNSSSGYKKDSADPRAYPDSDLRDRYTEFRKGWNDDSQEHDEQTTPE